MSKALDAIKEKKPIYWFEVRGVRIGAIQLTPNQWIEYVDKMQDTQDKAEEWAEYFAQFIVDEDGAQAFTIDEYKEHITNSEMEHIANQFQIANGVDQIGEQGN